MDEARVPQPRRESPLLWALYFLTYVTVLTRMLLNPPEDGIIQPFAYGLTALFLVLAVAQAILRYRFPWTTHVFLGLQTCVVLALLLTDPNMDYYALLFVGLSMVTGRDLPGLPSAIWLGVF